MNPNDHLAPVRWVKSSYSSPEGGNCLVAAPHTAATLGVVPVRDSKVPGGPVVMVTAPAWSTFIDHIERSA
ncbi:DUF397 domain-containing protein [Streptomyces sp. NPDC093252]|uniref:DUF397 domain-containing protein n=1 Tax=Streptomyces sp. NPDC093252 TaxID=3154980 RepID=UPI003430B372